MIFQRENSPLRHSGTRPIKAGKRPIKEGKRPINAKGPFSGAPRHGGKWPLPKRPIKRSRGLFNLSGRVGKSGHKNKSSIRLATDIGPKDVHS